MVPPRRRVGKGMGDTGTEGCSEELCQCGRKGRGSRCLPCPLPPFMAVTCELRERSVPSVFPSLQPQECILPLPPEVPGWEAMACFCLLSYPGMPVCDPCCWAMRGAIALLRCWTRFFSMLSRIFASLFPVVILSSLEIRWCWPPGSFLPRYFLDGFEDWCYVTLFF